MDKKLTQLTIDDNFQAKVEQILNIIVDKGFKDVFIAEAMRTPAQQQAKVNKGVSKTTNSYHVKRGKDGKGLAADIVLKSKGWNSPKRFWMLMGWLAWNKRIGWGGLFGLGIKQEATFINNCKKLSELGWPVKHELYETAIGWDPAHVQKKSNWRV